MGKRIINADSLHRKEITSDTSIADAIVFSFDNISDGKFGLDGCGEVDLRALLKTAQSP